LASTYFLESSLRLAPPGEIYSASPFEPRRVSTAEAFPNLDKFDAVVLADVADLDGRDAREISDLVRRGGGLLVFCGENTTAEKTRSLEAAGLTVGTITGVKRAVDLPLRMRQWDNKHPIFTAFNDPQLGDLQRLSFSACTMIAPAADAKVLASFGDGEPAVLERRVGEGSVLWFTSTCDRQWSEWTRSRLYLPFMYQLLGHQTGLLAGGKVRQAVLEGADVPPEAVEPGVQELQGYTLAVNGGPRESETERCSLEEFVERFGLTPAEESLSAEAVEVKQAGAGVELIDSEIWPLLAIVLLCALLLECLVANRTAA
jgi:hypothetical protein